MLLKQLKTTDFDPTKKYTFILPMGATEQHGPFLPFGTDTYCQDAILEQAFKECPEAIFLPTLEITCSKEHQGFPGTVWIEKETMRMMLCDICTSLKDYAQHIILTSWHGGNLGTIDHFVREQQPNFKEVTFHHVNLDSEDVLEKIRRIIGGPVDDHAGNTEISMVLAAQEALATIPPQDYPKHKVTVNWDAENALKNVSSDGIADNHPQWVVDKGQGKTFIQLSGQQLAKEIKRIMKS
jgi:creatinine amidohydrolase/Fe(II)-dependent formamide hydrolase-like protein